MKLSVWKLPDADDTDTAYIGFDGNRYGARDNRVIEDEDTGHLFVPLDEQITESAKQALAAARGTSAESAVRELLRRLGPSVNGPTFDAWLAAIGYDDVERAQEFGLVIF